MATEAQIRQEKEEKLQDILRQIGKVAVTYSGGIDSSYLLKVALDTLGPDNVIAAVVNSEMFSNEEFDLALDLADQLGAPVLGLEMRELSDPRIAANTPNIWYYTKQLMYQTIKDSVTELGFEQLVDGMIMDDINVLGSRLGTKRVSVVSCKKQVSIRQKFVNWPRKEASPIGIRCHLVALPHASHTG